MGRLFVTGDIHGDPRRLARKRFPIQREFEGEDNYVVILGDFGLVFSWQGEAAEETYWLDWLNEKNFTTLFVLGNHECFPRIYSYPLVDFQGGKAYQIRENVLGLRHGDIFELCGNKCFVFGGATSVDKMHRKENKTWWAEEIPSQEDFGRAVANLERHDYKVDYIFSHAAPKGLFAYDEIDEVTSFLKFVHQQTEYKQHFFGHYHQDVQKTPFHTGMYYNILEIGETE